MKAIMTATAAALVLLLTACDKPDKAAGEEQGFGISKSASGTPTREPEGSASGANNGANNAAQPAAPANEKPR